MMKKASVYMQEVFKRKQDAKGVLAKAKSARDKRVGRVEVDGRVDWVGKF